MVLLAVVRVALVGTLVLAFLSTELVGSLETAMYSYLVLSCVTLDWVEITIP